MKTKLAELLTLKNKTFLKNSKTQLFLLILLITALLLYLYGYEICYIIYNADDLKGQEREYVINKFWELRFSLYSVIIMLVFFVSKFQLNKLNKTITSIGFNLAFISAFDKIILREFDLTKYDSIIIFSVIFYKVIWFKYFSYE